jgi:alkanesulfonate monooxygenase SsuD/methylene tetrahydromethanopterin reductase-like flavin-dependent oxidoreductase (luciferase family)
MDYGRALRFGYFLTPGADDAAGLLETARIVDRSGLDLLGIQDHPYVPAFLDTWTLLSAIGAVTERVHLFPDVANLPLRPPAVLAKAAASLDRLTGGRVELGLGSGAAMEGVAALGGKALGRGDALGALEDAVTVIRQMWSGAPSVRWEGRFYRLRGVHPGPSPAHPIGVWLGVLGPRAVALAGRIADGWVPSSSYVPPARLTELAGRLDEAAIAVGRQPGELQRIYNVMGEITNGHSRGFLQGPPSQWGEELAEVALEQGMDTFVLATTPGEAPIRRFAEEVAPQVRQLVDRERARRD